MNFVNFSASERVDLADLNTVAQNQGLGLSQETLSYFAENPNATAPASVLNGFVTTNPTGNQIQVTRGTAILGQRQGLSVVFGTLTCTGDATQAIDVSSFQAGTYNVCITYQQTPSNFENRTFWQASTTPGEYAQNVSTRLAANWSMTIVAGTPGPEWLQIATLVLPGNVLTDTRPLYFEGRPDQAYASGWGSVADRNPVRIQATVGDLHTFTKAMRTALEDVKGPGLTRWWESMIGGQNIGFSGTPTLGRTAWVDANFFAQGSGTTPRISFDAQSAFSFNRTAQTFSYMIGSVNSMTLSQTSLTVPSTLGIGAAATSPLSVSSVVLPQVLFDGGSAASSQVKIQAQSGTTSLFFAPGGTSSIFETRATYGASLSVLDTYAAGVLSARCDSLSRTILGPATSGYAYPTSPATVSIADGSGNTHLRLDASGTSGVASILSLRANTAAAMIRFTPSATALSSSASFALQALPTAFALLDTVNLNNVFNYTPANRTLDMTGSNVLANSYNVAPSYQYVTNKANIYRGFVPYGSSGAMSVAATGGYVTLTPGPGGSSMFFSLVVPSGSTITYVQLDTTRSTTSSSKYNTSLNLYASNSSPSNGAAAATTLYIYNQTAPTGTSIMHPNFTCNIPTTGYQNFYVVFADSDANATNEIYSLQFTTKIPSLPYAEI